MHPGSELIVVFETHASSLDNEAGFASGWFDAALSSTGERQARALGERRRREDFGAVFSSDLARAVRTAAIAFPGRTVPIRTDARLRECDYGALTRCPVSEIEARRVNHIARPFPEGESYQQVARRVSDWLGETVREFAGRTVLAIGHRATYYALEHLVHRIPLEAAVAMPWQWQPGWIYRVGLGDRGSRFN
jgi:broad specificity phosphatase PhoE